MSKKSNAPLHREIADRVRTPLGALRMLSGTFRARLANALGSASELDRQREAVNADRKAMKGLLEGHEAELRKSRETTRSLLKDFNERLEMVTRHSRELAGEHKVALDAKTRQAKLDEKEQWLEQLSVDLAEQQAQAQALLKSLEERVRENTERQGLVLDMQESLTLTNTASQELAEKLLDEGRELQTRSQSQQDLRVELETGRAELERREQELAESEADIARREEDLLREQESRKAALDGREKQLVASHAAREEELDSAHAMREKQLDAGHAAREKELTARIEARERELVAREAAVEESRARLEHVQETVAATLVEVESLERRAQETQELLTQRSQELVAHEARLGQREKAVESWRTQAELRERAVQQRYDELESLESRKQEIRNQIVRLEQEHAARIAESDKELERHRQTLAESRDEAVRARDLYQRELLRLEKREAESASRAADHAKAEAALEARTRDLAEREDRIRTLEAQLGHMRQQQLEMRAVIASLTAVVGDDRSGAVDGNGNGHGLENGNGNGNGKPPGGDRASPAAAGAGDRGRDRGGAEPR